MVVAPRGKVLASLAPRGKRSCYDPELLAQIEDNYSQCGTVITLEKNDSQHFEHCQHSVHDHARVT